MRTARAAASMMFLALALAWPLRAAADEAADKAEQAARREAMLSAGRVAFCRVHFFFKHPSDAKEPGAEQLDEGSFELFGALPYEQLINHHESLIMPGLLLDDAGHVLVGDVQLETKYVDRIEVVAPDGARYPAQLDRLLDRATAVMLTISEPLKNWKAPVFAAPAVFDDANPARLVMLRRSGRNWFLALGTAAMDYPYEQGGAALERFSGQVYTMSWIEQATSENIGIAEMLTAAAGPMLLCDEKGQPVGALTSGFLPDPGQKLGDWEQQRLLSGPGIRFDDLRALGEKCNEELSRDAYKCVIQYRREEEGPGGRTRFGGGIMPFPSSFGRGRAEGADRELFGLAVSDRDVFVPQTISREELATVEKIDIVLGEKPEPAEFVAAFQDLSGFVVRLKEGALPAHATIAPHPTPERLRLFLTATLEKKAGKTHVEVKANRWLNEHRGYKDLYYISPAHSLPLGAWILDRDLEILGVYAGQRIVGEEIQNLGAGGRSGSYSYYGSRNLRRIFWTAELAPMLADPVAFADPQIRTKSEEEAKRLVWLGVESSPMTPDLAKQLKVEKATKDGTIGLYVNLLYRNSPAERLGIKEGDILVQVETAKHPGPIDLNASAMGSGMFRFDWRQFADYRTVEEVGEAQPRWPIQLNYLTMLLQSIGEGEQIKLTWIHGAETVSKDYRIELGPPNFLCAPKFKNKEIGLTVRDVTYEVRAALRLEDARGAVVVARVERGSPAEVARIAPFELITAIDGSPVATAKEFGESIKAAREAGKKSVRLTVELLGNSRLADLDITGAPAPKEKTQDD